jgi:hypothetical protein
MALGMILAVVLLSSPVTSSHLIVIYTYDVVHFNTRMRTVDGRHAGRTPMLRTRVPSFVTDEYLAFTTKEVGVEALRDGWNAANIYQRQ